MLRCFDRLREGRGGYKASEPVVPNMGRHSENGQGELKTPTPKVRTPKEAPKIRSQTASQGFEILEPGLGFLWRFEIGALEFCPWHRGCSKGDMLDVALSVLALVLGGLTLELFAAAKAPLGYQDERGFHFGVEKQTNGSDSKTGNPK